MRQINKTYSLIETRRVLKVLLSHTKEWRGLYTGGGESSNDSIQLEKDIKRAEKVITQIDFALK